MIISGVPPIPREQPNQLRTFRSWGGHSFRFNGYPVSRSYVRALELERR